MNAFFRRAIQTLRGFAPFDFLALGVAIVSVVFFVFLAGRHGAASELHVQADAGAFVYPLDTDRTLTFEGPLGSSTVEIRDGRVRVADDPGPLQICVRQGWIDSGGEWLACLPSRLFLQITGDTDDADIDAQTF